MSSAFDLAPDDPKADPELIAADEAHFAAIAVALEQAVAGVADGLAETRQRAGGGGQAALERDLEVHRLTARLRLLRRFGTDLCLGRMAGADGEHVYIGRTGLKDAAGETLLIDWRTPAAEPFFGATAADPMGLVSRRRYRWGRGRVVDYWDEALDPAAADGLALDEDSAFIASLAGRRTGRMRDVLATIQADQDAIIRAGSRGALVVDGGPGTGKTVVALHRAAYLLYTDPMLGDGRGGVLVVGPHQPYLAYVADVLPSLGEDGVRTCTIADLVPEGADAAPEPDPQVARLKASAAMVGAIGPAVGLYEEPPDTLIVEADWGAVVVSGADWTEAFAAGAGIPHNEARETVRDALLEILVDRCVAELEAVPADVTGEDEPDDRDTSPEAVDAELRSNSDLETAIDRAWPMIEPADLVGDLWTVPAYLRRCAPWLSREEIRLLQREDADAWTDADLPLLDAARRRLGDPQASRRQREYVKAVAHERDRMSYIVDELLQGDHSPEDSTTMLMGEDLQEALVDDAGMPRADPDRLAGPFAHIVVDEAQELTDAQWQMLLARCPSRSLTVVGDRAQARHGFTESWEERLARLGFDRVEYAGLTVNYRTPAEVMAEAAPVIREVVPDANVPTSIRESGMPVLYGGLADLAETIEAWLEETGDGADHALGTACVIGAPGAAVPEYPESPRVRTLTPELAKGLEFDLVVLLRPEDFGDGIEGAVDRYVSMTRATRELVVLR